jgi:hypothetical protein
MQPRITEQSSPGGAMSPQRKQKLRIATVLFFGSLLAINFIYALVALVARPFLLWMKTGVLNFSTTSSELLRLIGYASGLAFFVAFVIWLEGKWKGRW